MVVGLIVGLGIVAILAWMYIDTRKEFTSQHLQNTLKDMHKQLLHLKDDRLSHDQPSRQELEEMIPVLMHKLGIVDIGDWDKFIKKTARQMKGAITQRGMRQGTWHYQLASVTSRMQRDLLTSKESTISDSDIDILAEWFGRQSWAIKDPYRTDKQWTMLYNSIEPFTRDNKLQSLINDHILVTYVSSNALLVDTYMQKWPNSLPMRILHQTLQTSDLSPLKVNGVLSDILGGIDKRMDVLHKRTPKRKQSEKVR